MSVGKRIVKIIVGVVVVVLAILMILQPDWGYMLINAVLGIALLVSAIGSLIYYFRLARHMVGGRSTLFSGLIQLDLAVFTLTLTDLPKIFLMIYLVSVFGVTGVLRLARGLEARSRKAPAWYWSFLSGLFYVLIAFLCTIFISNNAIMVMIFSVGMLFMGVGNIVSSFYRSKIVYVQ